jgi:hypothetical protein
MTDMMAVNALSQLQLSEEDEPWAKDRNQYKRLSCHTHQALQLYLLVQNVGCAAKT